MYLQFGAIVFSLLLLFWVHHVSKAIVISKKIQCVNKIVVLIIWKRTQEKKKLSKQQHTLSHSHSIKEARTIYVFFPYFLLFIYIVLIQSSFWIFKILCSFLVCYCVYSLALNNFYKRSNVFVVYCIGISSIAVKYLISK